MKNNMTNHVNSPRSFIQTARLAAVCRIMICLTLSGFGLDAVADGAAGTNPPPASVAAAITPESSGFANFYIELGYALLQPFSITPSTTSPGKFTFTDSGGSSRSMDQVLFLYRNAWANIDLDQRPSPFDVAIRIGYAAGGSGSESSGSTGGGDLFSEGSIGWNLPLKIQLGSGTTSTLNLETFGRAISDSEYSLIHTTYGIGPAFVLGIPFSDPASPKVKFMARIAYAQVDTPIFIGPNLVGSDSDGNPTFRMRGAMDATVQLHIPVGALAGKSDKDVGFLSFGGSFDKFGGSSGPDQWSFFAAYTISIGTLLGKF
jgi:hypothetical protein